ncbi:MAG: BamA/TamA family outer membrane protein [Saprospiraceae bacterium]|nr:BamA/TamA family outer membrane protein [Saprospiraceae bacterium]
MKRLITILSLTILSASVALAQEPPDTIVNPIEDVVEIDYRNSKTFKIENITVTGTDYLNHELLIDNSGLKVGSSISIPGDEISNSIKKLWKLGLFENIEINLVKVGYDEVNADRLAWLNINLLERPRVAGVKFTGTTNLEAEDLTESLKLIKGKPITSSLKLNINKVVQDYYADKGFLNASSSFLERPDTVNLNSSYLEINVDKGQKVKISNIIFEGNKSIPSYKLKKVLKGTKEKTQFRPILPSDPPSLAKTRVGKVIQKLPYITIDDLQAFADNRLSFQLFNGSKYIDEAFDDDKRELIRLYNADGFRDAEVTFDTLYQADARNAIVKIRIDEGEKYYFRNITFKGNTKYSDDYLDQIMGIEKGDIYDESLLEARTTRDPSGRDISSLYMDNGYLFFRAIPVEKSIVGDSVDIEIFINEGKQATIGEVMILGNDKTHEHVIRRELFTKPGDTFNRTDIINSQQRIATMGFFDETQIGIRPINVDQATGTVDLEYTVVEKSNDQVQMQFGYGGERVGVIGQLGMTLTNFSANKMFKKGAWRPLPTGDGQRLAINASLNSTTNQTYSFSFTEPWLGGKRRNSLQTSFFKQDFNFFENQFNPVPEEEIGEQNTTGVDVLWGRSLNAPDPFFFYRAGLSYQRYQLVNSNAFLIRNGNSTNFAITQGFGRNNVSAAFFPKSGSNISLTAKITPPWSLWRDSNFKLTDAEIATAIAEENDRRANEMIGDGNFPLIQDGEAIPADYPARLLIAYEGDFIRDVENRNRYELIEYHKWNFDAEWYQQLGRTNFVLRPYAKLGYLGAYNTSAFIDPDEPEGPANDGISPFERFRFGGDGLAQGITTFGTTIISQRGYDDDTDYPQNRQGGYPIYNKFGLELRYNLSGEGSTPIYALSFLEGGNAYTNFDEYDPFNLNRSAGIGLRLQLPFFGLIGFDYGVGFDKNLPSGAGLGDRSQFNLILGVPPQ